MEICQVLAQQRLVETEPLLVLPHHRLNTRLDIAAELRLLQEFFPDRILPGQSGQKEVEGRRQPDDQQKNAARLCHITKLHYSPFPRRPDQPVPLLGWLEVP